MDDERAPLRRRGEPADTRPPPRRPAGPDHAQPDAPREAGRHGEPRTRPVPPTGTTDHVPSGRHARVPGWLAATGPDHSSDGRRRNGAGPTGTGSPATGPSATGPSATGPSATGRNGTGPNGTGRNGVGAGGVGAGGVGAGGVGANSTGPNNTAAPGMRPNGVGPGGVVAPGWPDVLRGPSAVGGSGSHRLEPADHDHPTGLIVGRGGAVPRQDHPTTVIAGPGVRPGVNGFTGPAGRAGRATAGRPPAGIGDATAFVEPGRGRSGPGAVARAPHPVVGDVPPPGRRPGPRVPPPADEPPPPGRRAGRRTADGEQEPSLGRALAAALASTVVPGTGLLMVRRRRSGTLVLGVFLLVVVALLIAGLTVRRSELVQNLLSSRVLLIIVVATVLAGLAWIAQIVRTYVAGSPRDLPVGRQVLGIGLVTALCLGVAAPFGYAAQLANSQRSLLDTVFAGNGGGTSVVDAIAKPRLNILLVGSDAGPDRTGARTDTMMVASIDTHTARTTIFGLPRNIGYARFPPGSALAAEFPKGFHDPNGDATSGDYLLNAVYAYALAHPKLAPAGPTKDVGLNALHETVSSMLGIDLDYYVEVNMAGFASIIDALGGVTVDVGPVPLPIDGVLPDGAHDKPSGYVPAGVQHLTGIQALWFARSRRNSDDYNRMGRQRCLLQSVLVQKSPADVITHFQAIADATTNSVATNVPQEVLGQLVSLVGGQAPSLQSVAFDPNLPDPTTGTSFDPNRPDVAYMRQVVQDAINPPATTTAAGPTTAAAPTPAPKRSSDTDGTQTTDDSATPESLATSCG